MNTRRVLALLVQALALPLASVSALRNATATIDIIAYNDVYEMLQDAVNDLNLGGPSRVVPLVKEMRAANPNSLVLFAGDTMSPSLWSSQFYGMQMVEAHNALTLDFACLGNHEFDFGVDRFLNVSQASNFPWLNANCYELATGELLRGTQPSAVKTLTDPEFGTITIGFFGVMYDMKDSSKGLFWTDPIEAAKVEVAALQAQGVDFIIALTHQDWADDNTLSQEVDGIDLIYAGHDHTAMMQTTFGAPYLKADLDFRTIWRSHIQYFAADSSNDRAVGMTHSLVPITEDLPTDPELDAIIAEYDAEMSVLESEVVGSLCAPLDLTTQTVRVKDCAIGSVFADACLTFYGNDSADIAVMNGGGIRTDTTVPAGDLTLGEIIAWSPFGNTLMTISTNGASLKLFIEHEMLASCGDGVQDLNGFYVHPAGMKYTYTCTDSGVGSVTSMEWFDHPTHNGTISESDEFVLALSNYLYTSEFLATDGVSAEVIVSEAEAERVDAALEQFVKAQPGAVLCYNATGRSEVVLA